MGWLETIDDWLPGNATHPGWPSYSDLFDAHEEAFALDRCISRVRLYSPTHNEAVIHEFRQAIAKDNDGWDPNKFLSTYMHIDGDWRIYPELRGHLSDPKNLQTLHKIVNKWKDHQKVEAEFGCLLFFGTIELMWGIEEILRVLNDAKVREALDFMTDWMLKKGYPVSG